MAQQPRIETDPLGHRIILEGIDLSAGAQFAEPEEILAQVIRKPAMLIEIKSPEQRLYFFRSVDWSHTLLVGAELRNGEWQAFSCVQNPTSTELSELLKKGRQLI